MKLSIIIVGCNIKEYLIPCLKSIAKGIKGDGACPQRQSRSAGRGGRGVEVIYVDNGSDDGSVKMIEAMVTSDQWLVTSHPARHASQGEAGRQSPVTIRLIKNSSNLGFTKANNLGAKKARGEYLLFLNSDTEIVGDALKKMVDYLEKHSDIGVLGPKLFNSKKMDLQVSSTGKLTPLTAIFSLSAINKFFPNNSLSKKYFIPDWNRESTREVENVSGAAMMMSKRIFERIGGFDERYFIYFEETDLCMAVKRLGKKVVYYPLAGIIHYGGKTTIKMADKMKKIFLASRFKFFKKHYGFMPALITESILRFMEKF